MPRKMLGDLCLVCGNYRKNNPQLSFHRFPTDPGRRSLWVRVFELDPEAVKPHHRVCCRHFFNGDPKNGPQPHIGRRFASPIKKEATGVPGPLEDSKFGGYKNYNPLAAQQAMALVTPRRVIQLRRVPQAYPSYLQFMMLNRQQSK